MSRSFIAAAFAALVLAPVARAESRFGFVDLQRAIAEIQEGREAKARLKKEFDERQSELDAKQEEVKQAQADLKAHQDAMSDEAKRKAEQEMDQKMIEVSRLYQSLQKELMRKEQETMKPILAKMTRVIKTIAENEGLTMVFEQSQGLLYAQPSLDLTNEVIRRYNGAAAKKAKAAVDSSN